MNNVVTALAPSFLIGSSSFLQATRKSIISWMGSKFGRIRPGFLHRLEKYLNLEGFLEKSLKIKSALKSTGKSLKSLEKSLNFTIICRT